jgi:hypothetical protein
MEMALSHEVLISYRAGIQGRISPEKAPVRTFFQGLIRLHFIDQRIWSHLRERRLVPEKSGELSQRSSGVSQVLAVKAAI